VNVSGKDQCVKDGLFLGLAVHGECVSDSVAVEVLSKGTPSQGDDVTGNSRVSMVTGGRGDPSSHADLAAEQQADCDEQNFDHAHRTAMIDVTTTLLACTMSI